MGSSAASGATANFKLIKSAAKTCHVRLVFILATDLDEDEDDESDDEVFNWLEEAGLIEEPVF